MKNTEKSPVVSLFGRTCIRLSTSVRGMAHTSSKMLLMSGAHAGIQDARRILDYANEREYTDVAVHVQVKWSKPTSKLVRLREDELKNFFKAIDQYHFYTAVLPNEINELTCKAIFKLMYSNWLRPVEVRELEREDVDLVYGVIKIRRTKGYRQHQIVVNDDMLMLLKRYDEQVDWLVQHRSSFFLNGAGRKLGRDYIDTWFSRFWYKYNSTTAVAYYLRHNYAIANFNAMGGMNIDEAYKYIPDFVIASPKNLRQRV